ncbi:hypothetical protein CPCC7001_1498 [Cyanobium sp. PCC 7001]|nr:hypothetical protein CPCC7001_1498 [Cyanobium sp. PCC 7001]
MNELFFARIFMRALSSAGLTSSDRAAIGRTSPAVDLLIRLIVCILWAAGIYILVL